MLLAPNDQKPADTTPPAAQRRTSAKHLYTALLGEHGAQPGSVDELSRSAARGFLTVMLSDAAAREDALKARQCDEAFPDDLRALPLWLERQHQSTAQAYRHYLDARATGAPRRFFRNRSHALNFVRSVAPTKLVDGAWLYGVLPHWQDARLTPLIRIYLEELGDGVAARNHVLLYQQLVASNGCDGWQSLSDEHFVQGAVQLALAHHAADFLPEIIGFNLGYEQLPLHLPISAYELNELGVDPYYFTLHVTIDNASTGHARKALQCVLDAAPRMGDKLEFRRRVANGYRLNDVGMGSNDAIANFDLDRELLAVFRDKAAVGALLHSDYCQVGGRKVSEWLSTPALLPQFLSAMQTAGWIRRGEPPEHSRFWRMLTDTQAPMFGVFNDYEQQLIRDWIMASDGAETGDAVAAATPSRPVNRFRQRAANAGEPTAVSRAPQGAGVGSVIAHHLCGAQADGPHASDPGLCWLRAQLAGVNDKRLALQRLQGLLSPGNHPTPAGLTATRLYADLLVR